MNETNVETGVDAADSDVTESDPPLGVGVVTVASNRTLESDAAGEAIGSALEEAGHEVATREHVGPDHDRVQSIVLRVIERDDVDLVVTAGATSVEPDDVAIEAIEPLLDRELPAFGDLFTMLAYESVGTRVVAARTLAGVAESTPVFSLPGNAEAARIGVEEILLHEARHLVELARGNGGADDDGTDDDDQPQNDETTPIDAESRNGDGTDDAEPRSR
ncbi:molybdenum cofactor synthesis domain-containing protein [Natrialba sp. INN-245]|uniref:MogA/MoaB family molybdenum cofactor biosynthesis protein n=1 Tax=Natrialba sp. INN-245 TaxID=2690967 RepID=UPI0013128369|nr:molybdenum cofactor synthesis domain-containing protein [Natrialba sp. INN-245]MWV40884.1 molybdenum cofactor biosynthesis protein [Natrialba sp. INN-245]